MGEGERTRDTVEGRGGEEVRERERERGREYKWGIENMESEREPL